LFVKHIKLVIIYIVSAFTAYFLWVFFSYLIVPFSPPLYTIKVNTWAQDGYFKVLPGKYKNDKYSTFYTINSKGFRGAEFSGKGSKYRIVTIGASSTMGLESNEGETWPSQLQKVLTEDGHSVEVINCAIDASSSDHHLKMIGSEIIEYGPDIILYYAGRNDHAISGTERYPGPALWPKGRISYFKAWVIYKKAQIRFILLKWFAFDLETIFSYPNNWKAKYTNNLKEMIIATKRSKGLFVIITQVMDYPLEVFEDLASNSENLIKILQMKNKQRYFFLRQNDLLRIQSGIAKENDIKVIDLHTVFYKAKKSGVKTFYDNIHLTPEGNKLIARRLASYIEQEINNQYMKTIKE
tara:strand:- start:46 stop:1104 length:1059 start_codon:yes stop_codon:yes gene_type:complete